MGLPAPAYVAASGLPPAGDQANAVLSGTFSGVGPSQPFAFRGPMNLCIWASIATALTTTAGSLAATVASGTGLAVGQSVTSANAPPGTTLATVSGTNVTFAIPPVTIPGFVSTAAKQIYGLPSTAGLANATVTGPGIPAATTVTAIITAAVPATDQNPGSPGVVAISALPTLSSPNSQQPQLFTFGRDGHAITVTGPDATSTFTGVGATFNGTVQIERSFDGGNTWIVANIGAGTPASFGGAAVGPVSLTFGEPEKQVLYRLNCTAYSSGTINYRISQTGGAAESLAIGPLSGG